MIKLKILSLCSHWHFVAILLVLISLSFTSIAYALLLIGYLVFVFRLRDCKIIILIGLAYLILFSYYYFIKDSKIDLNSKSLTAQIVELEKSDRYQKIIAKCSGEKIMIYDYSSNEYTLGDIVLFEGELSKPKKASYEGDFDYSKYLASKRIYVVLTSFKSQKLGQSFVLESIKYQLTRFYEPRISEEATPYFISLVLGEKMFNEDLAEDIKKIGIAHIFAISGMHILLLYKIIEIIASKFTYHQAKSQLVCLILLGVYVAVLGFSPSALRAYMFLALSFVAKRWKIPLSKLDILSLVLIFNLFINPTLIYDVGFQLSYLVTFGLIICNELLISRNKLFSSYKLVVFCVLFTIPIVANLNGEINFLTLLVSPFFVFIFSFLLIPLCYGFCLLPFLSYFFSHLFVIINEFISILGNFDLLIIKFSYLNAVEIIAYYGLLFFVLISLSLKKRIKTSLLLLSLYLFLLTNIAFLNPKTIITFIDVGQGDSILIELPHNKGNILIDCYGDCLSYLQNRGLKKLEYLILTHSDNDHIASASKVLKELNVKSIIINEYENPKDFKLGNVKINSVKSGDSIKIADYSLNVVGPIKNNNNKNENSLVLELRVANYVFLFTGDMENQAEMDLITYYPNLKCDVLKVGHHGSDTSSSEYFIDRIRPKYSIISVGSQNSYGLPSSIILQRLKQTIILRTDQVGNISFSCNKRVCGYKNKNVK